MNAGACSSPAAPPGSPGVVSAPAAPPAAARPWTEVVLHRTAPGARTVRAEYNFDKRIGLPGSRLIEPMVDGAVVLMTMDAIYFDGEQVAGLLGGAVRGSDVQNHLIVDLHTGLSRVQEHEHVVVFADASSSLDPLVDVLYTAGRAGATSYQLAVVPTSGPRPDRSDAITIQPPKYSAGAPELYGFDGALVVNLGPGQVVVGRRLAGDKGPAKPLETLALSEDPKALERLEALARDVARELRGPAGAFPLVVMGVRSGVTLQSAVDVYDAVAGPQCTPEARAAGDRTRCIFLERTLQWGTLELLCETDPSTGECRSPPAGAAPDIIRGTVRANVREIRDCYNTGLERDAGLKGRVVVDFEIGSDGKVTRAGASDKSDLPDAEVRACIVGAVRRWVFPRPADGRPARVNYPFVLEPD